METNNETATPKLRQIGYHATERRVADMIVSTQTFRDSNRDNDWLGEGVYFFKYHSDAKWWAEVRVSKRSTPDILQAELEYSIDQMLDLDDREQFALFESAYQAAMKRANELSVARPYSPIDMQKQWCIACNLYRKMVPRIGIISYTFKRKQSIIPGLQQNQTQLCVSNHDIIGFVTKAGDCYVG